jgi:hypothetical protein
VLGAHHVDCVPQLGRSEGAGSGPCPCICHGKAAGSGDVQESEKVHAEYGGREEGSRGDRAEGGGQRVEVRRQRKWWEKAYVCVYMYICM